MLALYGCITGLSSNMLTSGSKKINQSFIYSLYLNHSNILIETNLLSSLTLSTLKSNWKILKEFVAFDIEFLC